MYTHTRKERQTSLADQEGGRLACLHHESLRETLLSRETLASTEGQKHSPPGAARQRKREYRRSFCSFALVFSRGREDATSVRRRRRRCAAEDV